MARRASPPIPDSCCHHLPPWHCLKSRQGASLRSYLASSLTRISLLSMMNSLRWILHFVWCLVALAAPWGKTPRVGSKESEAVPDPRWITDAPLVVAARCNDGVIVLAEHNREPLVWLDPEQPTGRLVVLDRSTTLVAVGWRPDGAQLARWGRTIVRTETETFGSPVHPAVVAQELAVLLATRRVSEQVRVGRE